MNIKEKQVRVADAHSSLEQACLKLATLYVDALIDKDHGIAVIERINIKAKALYEDLSGLLSALNSSLDKKNEPLDISQFVLNNIIMKTNTSKT